MVEMESAGPRKILASEAGRRLRRELNAGRFDRAAATGLRRLGGDCRVGATHGNRDIFAFADEVKMIFGGLPVDANHVAEANLIGS